MPKRLIEGVNRRGLKIKGQWVDFAETYEGLPHEEIEAGREYEVKFLKDNGGRWLVSGVYEAEGEGSTPDGRESRIARMNALTNAVNLALSKGVTEEEEVIRIADRFYRYIMQGY
ncbi:hypothetical protein [Hydrogenivirga caldilitoris]|uniref:hypothetical protein n=1 Tax=Hydrogenivirga caldilitoris TaxID=246264 RepID=UPI000EAFF7B4|nr:hypothetical protein [Hydrogenivirga caldilitoris]